jgi:hypothetical protein
VTGSEDPGPVARRWGGPRTPLRHGRWALEVRGDEVADIRFDGVLLLRAIRPVVRDRNWDTVPVEVVARSRSAGDGGGLETELAFAADGISYRGTLRVRLDEERLVVAFRGEAGSDFERNRIGLVVLHPAADAGREVEVRHPDGSTTAGRWPLAISPHQPFRDVAGFGWTTRGVTAELSLDGDVFETEDQRNWTDASFKTYSTPLDRPFPVQVLTGETCRQQARLHATGRASSRPGPTTDVVTVGSAVIGHVPALGLGTCLYPPPDVLPPRPGRYDTLLVELTDDEEQWPVLLAAAADQARLLATGLDVRVVTADPAAVRRCLALLVTLPVRRLGAFDPDNHLSTAPVWTALRDEAARAAFTGDLVGGTRAHFTELNRGQQQLPADLPALTFSLTPQMHATEVPHLLDSLGTQRTVVENAVRIAAGRPLHVGPVTLARRFNAVATTAHPGPAAEAAAAVDNLQDTAFAAAWTLASVAALSVPGVTTLCFFESAGPRGVLRQDGRPTPAGGVLEDLALRLGRALLAVDAPDGVAAMAVSDDDGAQLLLGNLTPEARTLAVGPTAGATSRVSLAPWAVSGVRLG